MTRAHWISTGVIAALATTAAIGQAQRQAAPGTIAVTERAGDPASAALPSVERLFDGYVRDNKMPGILGAFGLFACRNLRSEFERLRLVPHPISHGSLPLKSRRPRLPSGRPQK